MGYNSRQEEEKTNRSRKGPRKIEDFFQKAKRMKSILEEETAEEDHGLPGGPRALGPCDEEEGIISKEENKEEPNIVEKKKNEELEKKVRLERAARMERSWELLRMCKKMLEEEGTTWKKSKERT